MKLHGNAALSLKKRHLLCQRMVEEGWSLPEAAATAGGGIAIEQFANRGGVSQTVQA